VVLIEDAAQQADQLLVLGGRQRGEQFALMYALIDKKRSVRLIVFTPMSLLRQTQVVADVFDT
jgi:hypothetical protein